MSAEMVTADVLRTASELVAALHEHLTRFRHVVAQPASVSIRTAQREAVRIGLPGENLSQVCAAILTWFESVEDGKLSARRSSDGGTLFLELRGATADEVRLLAVGAVPWFPGLLPSLPAGHSIVLGPLIVRALANDQWEPDSVFPAAVVDLGAVGGED
ncbi:hypothetical protein [Actinokineospora pegani]|uniref:hypothetical protein n=1 Tax=Actinokineospora pegani TaxID=2654637 RepID=UPI0012EA770E|nr:hypothetical protein [Actinokineospora pegani]